LKKKFLTNKKTGQTFPITGKKSSKLHGSIVSKGKLKPQFIPAEENSSKQQEDIEEILHDHDIQSMKKIWISPKTFLHATNSDINWVPPTDINSIKRLKKRMEQGKSIDVPLLVYDKDEDVFLSKRAKKYGIIIDHEGRHRSYVAKKLAIKKMPVEIYCVRHGRFGCKDCCKHITEKKILNAVPQNPSDKEIDRDRENQMKGWKSEDRAVKKTRKKVLEIFN